MITSDGSGLRVLRFVALKCFCVLIICSPVLTGCTQGERPFLQVVVCLPAPQDRAAFIQVIQAVGVANHMAYLDRSADTEAELKATDHVLSKLGQNSPVMNLGLLEGDGVGLSAGNLGLPDHQFAVGFSEGSNPAKAHRLAEDVVSKLKQKWHVEVVPQGQGARSMRSCI